MDLPHQLSNLSIAKPHPEKTKAIDPLEELKKNAKRLKKNVTIAKKRPLKTKASKLFDESERTGKQRKQDPGISFEECDQENIDEETPYMDFDDHLPEGSPDLIKVSFINNSITLAFKNQLSDEIFEIPIKSFPFFITKIKHLRILPGSLLNSMTIIFTLEDDTKNDHKFKSENMTFSDFMAT